MVTRRSLLGLASAILPVAAVSDTATASTASIAVPLDDPAIRIIENCWIPMPDGCRLAARLFLPVRSSRHPCGAVIEYLPYRKRDAYRYRDDIEGATTLADERIPGPDITYGEAYRLRRVIREDDPNSAEIEAEAINSYARGDWRIRLRAWSRGRSTRTEFLCEETFEAWEGDRCILSRRWQAAVPRHLV